VKAAVIAVSFVLGFATAAAAQQWNSIDQRRTDLDQRIEAGVQEGQITRDEAARLREDFRKLVALEQRYRVNGLNAGERSELNRRFHALGEQIRAERRDREANLQGRNMSPERRMALAQQRIHEGREGGALTLAQTARLQADAQDVAGLQVRFAAGGYSMQERAELDRRFDALDEKIRHSQTMTVAGRR
jgi:hypothetical protein